MGEMFVKKELNTNMHPCERARRMVDKIVRDDVLRLEI